MIRTVYRFLGQIVYLLSYPVLRFKARHSKKWRERLGFDFSAPEARKHLWAHAASVGEVKALTVALEKVLAERPDIGVTLSVTSDKGMDTAERTVAERFDPARVTPRFLPLDAPRAIKRALDSAAPDLFLFTETEIWLNLLAELREREIPHSLINGRISESSFASYRRIENTMREALSAYRLILCQSEGDRSRFQQLGANAQALRVCGNLKDDTPPARLTADERADIRNKLGVADDEFLFVCGSVRPGEEGMLLDLFLALSPTHPKFKIALAPRHDEMITETEGAARQRMLRLTRYTREPDPAAQVIVVDKFGVLSDLYGAADLAFVGGTLVDIGGHNLLEPPQAGTAVVFGPSVRNVESAAEWLSENKFGFRANDWTELVTTTQSALDGTLDTRVSASAYSAARSENSPVAHTLAELRPLLESFA